MAREKGGKRLMVTPQKVISLEIKRMVIKKMYVKGKWVLRLDGIGLTLGWIGPTLRHRDGHSRQAANLDITRQ